MEIKQIADDILIDGKTILKNRYQKTRDRVTRFEHNYNMSDKEIIEFLDDEIRQYRNRIQEQEKTIKELQEKQTDECSKESCTNYHQCNHTSNIKFAKNYINEENNN